jgi:ankyrin repeat protein
MDILQELLLRKANVNIKDNGGFTPLYHAIINRNFKMVKELLKYGANVNETDNY